MDKESARQYRLVDQMLSMHARLRDVYERRAFVLNTGLIGVSLLLCVLAFVGDEVLSLLARDSRISRIQLGFIGLVLLLLSIAEYRVDWRGAGTRHQEAVQRLAALKALYRREPTAPELEGLTEKYEATMALLPPIPERWFCRLKARHLFKLNLSERLSANPLAYEWLVRVRLRLQGRHIALRPRKKEESF